MKIASLLVPYRTLRSPASSSLPGRHICLAGSALLFVIGGWSPAHSQYLEDIPQAVLQVLEDNSVTGRRRPEYEPAGLPLGSFRAYPELRTGVAFDDNVLRMKEDVRGDALFNALGRFAVRSEWTRHYLAASASVARAQYMQLTSENKTEWGVSGTGRLDILTGLNLTGTGSHIYTFESRTSRNQIGAARPTPIRRSNAAVTLAYNPYWLGLRLDGQFDRYDYSETNLLPSFGGGVRSNRDRTLNQYSVSGTALAEFSPGYAAFMRATYRERDYDSMSDRALGRDAQGYDLDAGVNLLLTSLVTGEAYVGYRRLQFAGPQFRDLSDVTYGASLRWYTTEVLNLYLRAARTPNPTIFPNASIADSQSVEMGVDYEFRRNVILQLSGMYTGTQFVGISRYDRDWRAQLGVSYLLNRYLSADLQVAHSMRSSNALAAGFDDNIVSVALTGHL